MSSCRRLDRLTMLARKPDVGASRRNKMMDMTKPIRFALFAALPLEFANLLIAGGSIKRVATDPTTIHRFLSTEAGMMHLPLGYLLPLVLKAGNPQHAVYLAALWLLISGYVDWALLIVAIIYGYRLVTRRRRARQD